MFRKTRLVLIFWDVKLDIELFYRKVVIILMKILMRAISESLSFILYIFFKLLASN